MDDDSQNAVTSTGRAPRRGTAVWTIWLILAVIVAVMGSLIGGWFWLQRPVQLQAADLYGTWVSDGPRPTTLEFTPRGTVTISGAPLPHGLDFDDPALHGETRWHFYPGADPSVTVGSTYGQSLYAENRLFSTVLTLYPDGPDLIESRVVFTRTKRAPSEPG
ncbi:hypothetical protein AB4Z18_12230 [Leifsonia sp. 2TAF2]|uniref:hypothetical protein n=1 Tax=Leifsonia sp. 2TAF2 TaxID=3233009 RepID=UPI003F9DCB2C